MLLIIAFDITTAVIIDCLILSLFGKIVKLFKTA